VDRLGLLRVLRPRSVPARRILWACGWSVPTSWFAALAGEAFPSCLHEVLTPGPETQAAMLASDADVLGGYSFGAGLALTLDDPRPRVLVAPFVDLRKESGRGGAVAATQIRHLLRWLRRDPPAAIADFHRRCGMESLPTAETPDLALLAWGLTSMLGPAPDVPAMPVGSIAVAGRRDPLLDVEALQHTLPGLHLADGDHHPQPLLAVTARLRQDQAVW